MGFSVFELDTFGGVVFDEDFRDAGVVVDPAAEGEVLFLYLTGEGQRAAYGVAGALLVAPGLGPDEKEGGHVGDKHVSEGRAQEGILALGGELAAGYAHPVLHVFDVGQALEEEAGLVEKRLGFGGLVERELEFREFPGGGGVPSDEVGVTRGLGEHFLFDAVDVGEDADVFAGGVLDAHGFFGLDEGEGGHVDEFVPQGVEGVGGIGADEPVDAAVEGVAASLPCGAEAAGEAVEFEDFGIVSVGAEDAAGGPAGDPGPDNVALLIHIGVLLQRADCLVLQILSPELSSASRYNRRELAAARAGRLLHCTGWMILDRTLCGRGTWT